MTAEERQELVDRLRSLADGIEDGQVFQTRDTHGWMDRGDTYLSCWLVSLRNARVKPESLECWVNVYSGGLAVHRSHEMAEEHGRRADRVAVHMREVVGE